VKPDDVLLNITGASIGRVCSVPDDFGEGNVSQHVCIIRPKKNRLLSGFLASYLSTTFMQREIRFEQNGASREGLTLDSIRNFKIVLPDVSEQQRILTETRGQTGQLVAAVNAAQREIELLKEYRTRLTADVVTGKLDVREAVLKLPEMADELSIIDKPRLQPG
jgi:type I restriction enzyme S subunit